MTKPDDIAGALAVAIARKGEAHADCPLFNDPYAQVFIDAAEARGCNVAASTPADRLEGFANYTSSRTKYFDEFFIAAGAFGIQQVVIVAAGLDARAWRLPWVSDTTIYEIDHPGVLRFKADALHAHGDTPSVQRYVPVPADLTDGWDIALRDAGFDPAEPTAWAIEGLLPYVDDGPHLLFDRIHELSAPSSRMAVEAAGPGITRWLADRGWQGKTTTAQELMTRHGRCGAHDVVDTVPDTVFVEAKRDR